ncbi:MAG: [Fe-Fe] hydrogenase large subunit C-terminal domain-containing protein [Clostridia bacterium]
MEIYFHSVTLDKDKCKACTQCIKNCPTEAIRVRDGKALILPERCIDCGECIRICPHHAKKAVADSLSDLQDYKYRVAIPAPSVYGQFDSCYPRIRILAAIKELGFDMVYDVSLAAELVSLATEDYIRQHNTTRPLISSACPAVVRLIQVRFPSLIGNIIKLESPMEVAAGIARKKAMEEHGVSDHDVGVFFITPCPAKVTSVRSPDTKDRSSVDKTIPVSDIYLPVLRNLRSMSADEEEIHMSGRKGISWAKSGGEADLLSSTRKLYIDGIHDVCRILEKIEDDSLGDVSFIEALACTGGCLGGALTIENPFMARKYLTDQMVASTEETSEQNLCSDWHEYTWTKEIGQNPVLILDDDLSTAMKKLDQIQKIHQELPGLDCGACGSPSCYAHAEDIVRGISKKSNCFHEMQEKVRDLENEVKQLKKERKAGK